MAKTSKHDTDFYWSNKELRFLERLSTPHKIQEFLDRIPYRVEDDYCCPREVIADRRAHCFDGALFAAAALQHQGYPPLVLDLSAVEDDDHVLAIFQHDRCWGAVAKSNFPGLRWREPVYRSVRELIMSYFEPYFNLDRKRTLRSYSLPLHLKRFDRYHWMFSSRHLEKIAAALNKQKHIAILTRSQERNLTLIDKRSLAASLVGMNRAGAR